MSPQQQCNDVLQNPATELIFSAQLTAFRDLVPLLKRRQRADALKFTMPQVCSNYSEVTEK